MGTGLLTVCTGPITVCTVLITVCTGLIAVCTGLLAGTGVYRAVSGDRRVPGYVYRALLTVLWARDGEAR